MNNTSVKTIHSGGAKGADSLFGYYGHINGYDVIHHSFESHKIKSRYGGQLIHPQEDLEANKWLVEKACEHLGKKLPRKTYVRNLILRNSYQVLESNLVVAVSAIEDPGQNVKVAGGTGYAVAMAMTLGMTVLLFDQEQGGWMYSKEGKPFQYYPQGRIPDITLFPNAWAGIGSRKINDKGGQAITDLFAAGKEKG